METAIKLAPPIVSLDRPGDAARPSTADLDAGWDFADEPAATDGALMGRHDAPLGEFPPGPSDEDIAALVDACADELCAPSNPRRRRRR